MTKETAAWKYEVKWPNDSEWFIHVSTAHPYEDENLDAKDSIEIRNITGLVEVDDE